MKEKIFRLAVLASIFCLMLAAQQHEDPAQQREDPVEVKVENLQATPAGVSVVLRAANSSEAIHMMIGYQEGQSIARAIHNEMAERPLSHDLFKAFLDRNGWHVQKVLIRDLKEGTFLADLSLEKNHETQVYDARPSDAIAIGIRYGAKIFVNPQVFKEQQKDEGEDENADPHKVKPDQPETLKL